MNIKKYIKGMSKDDLAKFANNAQTSPAYIKQIASGHRKAGIKTICKIMVASNGDVSYADLRPDMFKA